jgi:hypothetical protein
MAGRPRMYADTAEKNRAYRARQEQQKVKIRREDLLVMEEHLDRLRKAVYGASDAGDVLACSLHTVTYLDLLATLAAHFERCAVSPEGESR